MSLSTRLGVLVIIDGWGINSRQDSNAVTLAPTPFYDSLRKSPITAVGPRVGMPPGAKGSTAVGHEVLSGVSYIHPMLRVSDDIDMGVLHNTLLDALLKKTATLGSALHLMGLVSANREHSDIHHLYAIIRRAVQLEVRKIFIHFFSDGRGTPPFSAVRYAEDLLEKTDSASMGVTGISIATVGGRDITMNRSTGAWYKTLNTYKAIIKGEARKAPDIFSALKEDYDKGITDQYITLRSLGEYRGVSDNDTLLHWNFRKDRARLLMQLLLEPEEKLRDLTGEKGFIRPRSGPDYSSLNFCGLVEYYKNMPCDVLYRDLTQEVSLGHLLEEYGYRQYRVSGADKKHAMKLLSGGSREEPFEHEERIVVPLPEEMRRYVKLYDEKKGAPGFTQDPYAKFPEIELNELTDTTVDLIEKAEGRTFIAVNISNPDMVGHTADLKAGVKAAAAVDGALEKICRAAGRKNAVTVITSDHGNLETIVDDSGNPSTYHTRNPVPLIIPGKENLLADDGSLADVAPTMLYLLEPERKDDIQKKLKGRILIEN